jgi:hypothetical protein
VADLIGDLGNRNSIFIRLRINRLCGKYHLNFDKAMQRWFPFAVAAEVWLPS